MPLSIVEIDKSANNQVTTQIFKYISTISTFNKLCVVIDMVTSTAIWLDHHFPSHLICYAATLFVYQDIHVSHQ